VPAERAREPDGISVRSRMSSRFVVTGGGTGGHVFPGLAVARLLRDGGDEVTFLGTREGLEAKLVPDAGFAIDFLRIGGLNRVGVLRQLRTLWQLPSSVLKAHSVLRKRNADAVFSTGGYVAGPVMLAAILAGVPLVVMEPNAMPGLTNRSLGRFVYRALLGFETARRWFPEGRAEVTGLPVRREFFAVRPKPAPALGESFTVLITGGSRGARTLNRASRESWPLFTRAGSPVRIIHQAGSRVEAGEAEHVTLAREFATIGLEGGLQGEVVPFLPDMAARFAEADLIVGRAGAGSVAEIAAAGMPALLVPLPFAADDHQRKNAETLAQAGAAIMVADNEMTGARLFEEVERLRKEPGALEEMRRRVRQFAKPGAAERAAEVLREAAERKRGPSR
jgi:UDP-N-acetylglucosamine--N-acetylmuramyl-(pentapeptide) pyrophosphoryl-undecaprenol N-acetylglucosamine transferase